MPVDKNARKLRDILKSASDGKQADQAEVNAAVGRSTQYIIPVMVFLFTVNLPAALSLYWLTGGLAAYIQQAIVLRSDKDDMEKLAGNKLGKDASKIVEAEVVLGPKPNAQPTAKKKTPARAKRKKR